MTMLFEGRKISIASLFAGLGFASILASSSAACSSDKNTTFRPDELLPDAGQAETSACGYRCSPDLKKVIQTCQGEEKVTTCEDGLGCGVDTCVDACQSAALSKGSVGCSFWTLPPDDPDKSPGACFAAMIANTWDKPVNLTGEIGNEPLDLSQSIYTAKREGDDIVYTRIEGAIAPGEVALVFLAQATVFSDPDTPLCPDGVTPALKVDPIRHGTQRTRAFHLTADAPVSAYSIYPYGGADSFIPTATLLLPVSSWDKAYYAISTGKYGNPNNTAADRRTVQIVATDDETQISMKPSVGIGAGNGVDACGPGETQTWTLSRGQVLQITQPAELTGSPITANKPFGLFGGAPCSYLPTEWGACDVTQQQITPFAQWGTEYALVPYRSRLQGVNGTSRETVLWMMVGAADGTQLIYDPSKPPNAPDSLSAGQVVYFMTDKIASVKSQDSKHPFYVGVHMSGAEFGGGAALDGNGVPGNTTLGDADFMNIVPSGQFLDRYVFFTDFTFPDTSLTIVRRKTESGFAPVDLDCAGEVTDFQPLGTSGEYEYAWVHLTDGFVPQKFAKGECTTGRHEAHSDGPFSLSVWGIGPYASYGYAGGMGSRPINDAPPPRVN